MDIKNKKQLQVGDNIFFGAYPYDEDGTARPIKWRVLDVRDGKALLFSEYGLDTQPYHNVYENITWENCSLRAWLNQAFLCTAFTKEEEAAIQLTHIDNGKSQGNPDWSTDGGSDTQDKAFLLSYKEAGDYFSNANSRACRATPYAKDKRARVEKRGFCYFGLRSPGIFQISAAVVVGSSSRDCSDVRYVNNCVRPALWVNLNMRPASSPETT